MFFWSKRFRDTISMKIWYKIKRITGFDRHKSYNHFYLCVHVYLCIYIYQFGFTRPEEKEEEESRDYFNFSLLSNVVLCQFICALMQVIFLITWTEIAYVANNSKT